jgi:hypothetical protein
VVHTYNPNIQETEAGGSQVLGQAELQSKTLSQRKQKLKQPIQNKSQTKGTSKKNTLYMDIFQFSFSSSLFDILPSYMLFVVFF